MMALVLLLGLLCMFFGEIVPAGGGLGWDGVRYGEMVKHLPRMISQGELSTYYAQRILPSVLVRSALRIAHLSPENQTIIRAFQILDLAELVVACLLWRVIANRLRLGPWGRWFGFLSMFANFQNAKLVFFYPVLTDTTAFLAGMVMLWCYLTRRHWPLLVCTIVSSLGWPTATIMGALLLLFLHDPPVPEREPFAWPGPSAKRKGFVLAIAFSLLGIGIAWALRHELSYWRLFARGLSFLPSLYLVGLGLLEFLRIPRPLLVAKDHLASLTASRVGLALAAILVPQAAIRLIANRAVSNANSFSLLASLLFDPKGRPFAGLISAVMFSGPAIVFLVLRFPSFAREARRHGLGYSAVVVLTLLLILPGEPRYVTCGWPFVVALLAKIADQHAGPGFRKVYLGLTILLGQWWLPLTLREWKGGDFEFLLAWPKQLFYMHFGLWLAWPTYVVNAALVGTCFLLMRRVLRPGPVSAATSVET
jgi:hypothetical protein